MIKTKNRLKNSLKNRLAFSLIELLIVILVLGILVTAIAKGAQIIKKAKLSSAQSLTQNSPVNLYPHWVIWLETTLDRSFSDGENVDGNKISTWYDISLRSSPNNATQTVTNHKPSYADNVINGLPVVRFIRQSNKYLRFDGSDIANSNYTVIFVEQRGGNHNYNYFMCGTSNSGVANLNLLVGYFFDEAIFWGQNLNDYKVVGIPAYDDSKIPRIHTFSFDAISGKNYYLNGVNQTLTAINSPVANQGLTSYQGAAIGCDPEVGYPSYVGDIAEVIIFSENLKDSERIAIESYLKDKWGI